MARFLKGLEQINKALWKRVFRIWLVRKRRAGKDDLERVRKVIFLRYDRIGDMVVSTPLFRGIKTLNKNIEVGVLASPTNARVVADDPNVDHVHVFCRSKPLQTARDMLKARRAAYEAAVNLNLNDSLTGSLLANLVAPQGIKIARASREHAYFYDLLVPIQRENRRSMVELLYPFLEVFGPLPSGDLLRPYLAISDASRARVARVLQGMGIGAAGTGGVKPFLVVNVSAGDLTRQWSEDGYVEFLRRIGQREGAPIHVVVLSDPRDEEMRERIAMQWTERSIGSYPSTHDLMEVAALIGMAKAIITPDTSMIHFASAMNTPVVGLYTPQEPRPMEWQPYGVPHRSVFAADGEPVSAIPVDDVLAGFDDLMQEVERTDWMAT